MTSPNELIETLRTYATDASKTAAYRLFYQDREGQQESQAWANAMFLAAQYLEGAGEEVERAADRIDEAKIERDKYGWAIRNAPHDEQKDCGGFGFTEMKHCVCWKSKALA
jgi:hypothetical protein